VQCLDCPTTPGKWTRNRSCWVDRGLGILHTCYDLGCCCGAFLPSIIDLDSKATNLAFLENVISLRKAINKVPFDPVKNDLSLPNLVEFQGGYFIFNGNHRIYAVRNLDPSPPGSIRVNLFVVDEFAGFTGRSRQDILRLIGRATKTPSLGP
jgi:hypothetical protein